MRNIPHKVTGDDLTADEFNDIPEEEENLVTSSGQTLSAGDLYQIAKAVATYAAWGDFYVDSGAANAYVLTPTSPLQAPIQYADGMRVRFRISHTNTGPVTINVNALGVKAIVKEDGVTPIGAGDLPAGEHGEVIFHADIDAFELYSHKYEDQTFSTGDNLWSDNSAPKVGWILVNNSTLTTIGDASSASTIRANDDCQELFTLYWGYDAVDCPIYTSVGGDSTRGATALDDWNDHKRMSIPSAFRRTFAAHDVNDSLRIGQVEGAKTHALVEVENGPHNHVISDPGHTHPHNAVFRSAPKQIHYSDNDVLSTGPATINVAGTGIGTLVAGAGLPHNIVQPTIYKNLFIKL